MIARPPFFHGPSEGGGGADCLQQGNPTSVACRDQKTLGKNGPEIFRIGRCMGIRGCGQGAQKGSARFTSFSRPVFSCCNKRVALVRTSRAVPPRPIEKSRIQREHFAAAVERKSAPLPFWGVQPAAAPCSTLYCSNFLCLSVSRRRTGTPPCFSRLTLDRKSTALRWALKAPKTELERIRLKRLSMLPWHRGFRSVSLGTRGRV